MKPGAFRKENSCLKGRDAVRRNLMYNFMQSYKELVLVHAVHKKDVFKKILNDGLLKIPSKHDSRKKTPYMEKLLGIDNSLYYSIGFVYFASFGWKYNILFDINFIKECKYYKNSINYQCYLAIINYWYKNDKEYLDSLGNINAKTRSVLNTYYNEEYNGRTRRIFDFWKIEEVVYNHIMRYPKRKEIMDIIKNTEKKVMRTYPYSLRDARKAAYEDRAPEIVGMQDNNLISNKHFIGFYIPGNIPRDIQVILRKKYPDKILFDGIRNMSIRSIK